MPTSNLHNAPEVCRLVRETGSQRVLDVGPGWGKYGVLLREYAQAKVVDAVEAWEPYVADHRLRGIYDDVIVADVLDLDGETLAGYDCVLMVSVIEHLDKKAALAFLGRLPGWAVIATPAKWMQENHPVPTERHKSLWTVKDFGRRVDVDASKRGAVIVRLRPTR